MRSFGTVEVFDYRSPSVTSDILGTGSHARSGEPAIPLILDCIGSLKGTVEQIAKLAQDGAIVAVLLPIIVKDSSDESMPEYAMDVSGSAPWAKGVDAVGVRTHFYLNVSH